MMTEKQEKELLEIQCRKQAESRKVRSTAAFYDADYWGEYWGARFNSFPDENDPVTKNETLKKVEFIKRYFTRCQSILDCACSFGFIPAAFQDIGWRAAGVDISKAAIEHAPERVRDKIYPVSITDMNMFADSSFDLVCAFDVPEHVHPQFGAINIEAGEHAGTRRRPRGATVIGETPACRATSRIVTTRSLRSAAMISATSWASICP